MVDACKGHLTPEVTSVIHVIDADLVVIPGEMISQLQVLDVVNRPLKIYLKQLYSEWLLAGNHNAAYLMHWVGQRMIFCGRLKRKLRILAVKMVSREWQQ